MPYMNGIGRPSLNTLNEVNNGLVDNLFAGMLTFRCSRNI